MMNDFKVYKTIHFPDEWAAQNTAMFHKEYNTKQDAITLSLRVPKI